MARITIPGTTVGVLSAPSKMPCSSFGLPAIKACPSAFFGAGAICGESKEKATCYAMNGAYVWHTVRAAYQARFEYAIKASMDAATGDEFVALLVEAISKDAARQIRKGETQAYFRVHDSGDLFSPSYTNLWTRICRALPDVRFWFPTRTWTSKNLHMQAALLMLSSLPNVTVRPSALRFEDDAPVVPGLAAGSTASVQGFNCPACWNKDTVISYRKH
jgi:hypothetical protein